ncbi:hypothetical protein BH11PLA1_BH11PLA1_18650 [soil metagenome]
MAFDDDLIPAAPRARRLNVRRVGLLTALAAALISGGVILFLYSRSTFAPGGGAGGTGGTLPVPADAGAPLPAPATSPTAGDVATVGAINRAVVQFVDRKDPKRTAGMLRWDTLEPLPGGRANITRPGAEIYFKDGRTVAIGAQRGSIFRAPGSEEPESGTFEGDVIVTLHAPANAAEGLDLGSAPVAGAVALNAKGPALVTVHTDSLRFDRALYEVTTTDAWSLESAALQASGVGIRLVGNDVANRLEFGEIERLNELVYDPKGARAMRDELANPAATRRGKSGAGAPAPAIPGAGPDGNDRVAGAAAEAAKDVTLYQIRAARDVAVVWGERSLTGDATEVFLRLINNQLAPGALGAQEGAAKSPAMGSEKAGGVAPENAAAKEMPKEDRATELPIRLTCSGRVTVRPLDETPSELARDDAVLRITSAASAPVAFADRSASLQGSMGTLEYAATRREATLRGGAPGGLVVETAGIDAGRSGEDARAGNPLVKDAVRFAGDVLVVNLSTGTGAISGAGVLTQTPRAPSESNAAAGKALPNTRRIEWKEGADFQFAVTNGVMSQDLLFAVARGGAHAGDAHGELTAETIRAEFAAPPSEAADSAAKRPQAALHRLDAAGNVFAQTLNTREAEHGDLAAQRVIVTFAVPTTTDKAGAGASSGSPTASPLPQALAARGKVVAQRGLNKLSADSLDVEFNAANRSAEAVATSITATGNLHFTGAQGVDATAEALSANPETLRITLIAPTAEGVVVSGSGATITASNLMLDGVARSAAITGPGTLAFDRGGASAAGPKQTPEFVGAWSEGLTFDDKAGTALLRGNVRAAWNRTPEEVQQLWASTLDMTFTPDEQPTGRVRSSGAPEARRQVIRALARGDAAAPARIESIRSVAGSTTNEVARLIHLEGASIAVSETNGTLEVPGAGKLLVDERPTGASGAAGTANTAAAPTALQPVLPGANPLGLDMTGSTAGTSLFSWRDGMLLNRGAGTAEMRGATRLIRRGVDRDGKDSGIVTIDADRLFGQTQISGPSEKLAIELLSVEATGNATVQGPDAKKVTADRISYAALKRILTAEGDDLARVTLFDPGRPTPVAARRIVWDMTADRLDIIEPAPITAPLKAPQ